MARLACALVAVILALTGCTSQRGGPESGSTRRLDALWNNATVKQREVVCKSYRVDKGAAASGTQQKFHLPYDVVKAWYARKCR